MLISASLRSGLSGSGNSNVGRPISSGWQLDGDSGLIEGAGESARMARMEQGHPMQVQDPNSVLDGVDVGSLVAAINQINAAQLQPLDQPLGQQQYPAMDKREYIKPCSFNAISCVRTPFRKL
jgi:hypothetical protein